AGPDTGRTMSIVAQSEVTFERCTLEQGAAGLFLNRNSDVSFSEGTLQDNGQGARIAGKSVFNIGDLNPSTPASIVRRNGTGIQGDESSQVDLYGEVEETDNGVGVDIVGGQLYTVWGARERITA